MIDISPSLAILIALIGLILTISQLTVWSVRRTQPLPIQPFWLICILLLVGIGLGSAFFLTKQERNNHQTYLIVDESELKLGTVKKGEIVPVSIRIQNPSKNRVKLLGATANCSCVKMEGLPCELSPFETKELNFYLKTPKQTCEFLVETTLLTNIPKQPQIPLTLSCSVIDD